MTEKDMYNVQQLKKMLEDESTASLSDILGIIAKLPCCDDCAESVRGIAPIDILHGYCSSREELWGISEHCFWALNNRVTESDFKDYFRCIEALPNVILASNVMRMMMWGMGEDESKEMVAAFVSQIPPFLLGEKWNGSKSFFLALRGAIDCVDVHQQNGLTSVVLSIVRSRTGLEKVVATVASITLVVRALAGNLDEKEDGRDPPRNARDIQLLDLYKVLKKENEECLKSVPYSLIAPVLFSLDVENDWKITEKSREAGLSMQGGIFSYAEAIIVVGASGIVLSREECIKICTLAFYCAGRAQMWRLKVFKPVALFMADLIAGFDDSKTVWLDICKNVGPLIYRGLHEYRTSATVSLSDHVEIFVGVAFALVCDFCNKGRINDAMEVWAWAWSECVTALYAFTATINGFIPLVQYLFVKAGLCFTNEAEAVPSGAELLGQLPLVEVWPDESIDCAEVCIKALKGNLNDVAVLRIRAKDPSLARRVDVNCLSKSLSASVAADLNG